MNCLVYFRWGEWAEKIKTRCPSKILLEWPVLQYGEFILAEMALRLTLQKEKAKDLLHGRTKKFVAASMTLWKNDKSKRKVN